MVNCLMCGETIRSTTTDTLCPPCRQKDRETTAQADAAYNRLTDIDEELTEDYSMSVSGEALKQILEDYVHKDDLLKLVEEMDVFWRMREQGYDVHLDWKAKIEQLLGGE